MRLGDAIELFLSQYSKSSAQSYRSPLMDLATRFLSPERELSTIDSLDLIRYMQVVDSRENVRSPKTYNKYVKTLRTFFNWCVKLGMIESSPAKAVKIKSTRGSVPKSKAMPPATLSRLLSFYRDWETINNDPRPLALISFLSDTGCRIGGAATLTRDRLGLDKPITENGQTIYRAMMFEKGRPEPNTYYYSETTAQAIRRWILIQPRDLVFSIDGEGIKANNLARRFRHWCVRAQCGSWGPHSLRHAKGHHAAKHLPPSVGARILNNTVDVFLQYYAPKEEKFVREGAALLLSDKPENKEIINITDRTG